MYFILVHISWTWRCGILASLDYGLDFTSVFLSVSSK